LKNAKGEAPGSESWKGESRNRGYTVIGVARELWAMMKITFCGGALEEGDGATGSIKGKPKKLRFCDLRATQEKGKNMTKKGKVTGKETGGEKRMGPL